MSQSAVEAFFMLLGAVFILIGTIGVYRLPDVLCRAHALTKAITLGICSILFAALLHLWSTVEGWKILLVILFQMLTIPISGHLLALVVQAKNVPISSLRPGRGVAPSDEE